MKTTVVQNIVVVLALMVCALFLLPSLWYAVQHARRLAEVVQEWQASGPHTTLLGCARKRLAAAGWLAAPRDPLVECGLPVGGEWKEVLQMVLHAEAGLICMEKQVQLAEKEHLTFRATFLLAVACLSFTVCLLGWALARNKRARLHRQPTEDDKKDLLPGEESKTQNNEARVTMEQKSAVKHTRRAKSWPHKAIASVLNERPFTSMEKLKSCVLETVPGGHITARDASPVPGVTVEDTRTANYDAEAVVCQYADQGEGVGQEKATPRVGDTMTPSQVQATGTEVPCVEEEEKISPKQEEVEDILPPDNEGEKMSPKQKKVENILPPDDGEEIPPQQEEQVHLPKQEAARVSDAPLQTPPDSQHDRVQQEGQQEAGRFLRRSLNVPPKLRDRLVGADECFLEYLQRRHSVLIFMDSARRKMHIKGPEKSVVECYNVVKALLAEWQGRLAATAQ